MSAPLALKRGIRFRDLVPLYVVIVLSVRWTATAAAAGPSIFVIWFAALTCFFIPLAGCVMELSSRHPDEGGIYVWTREAFGDFSGFICAWTYWMSNLPYFPALLYFGAASVLFAFGPHAKMLNANPLYYMAFATVALAIITLLNIVGVNAGKWLNNIGALGTIVPLSAAADGRDVLLAVWVSHPLYPSERGSSLVTGQRSLLVECLLCVQRD